MQHPPNRPLQRFHGLPCSFSSMPIWGISWISIVASILLGLLTVLLAARSPARRAAKVSPLTAVSGNAGQIATFHKAANTKTFKIETALGIHHAKAKKLHFNDRGICYLYYIVSHVQYTC